MNQKSKKENMNLIKVKEIQMKVKHDIENI